MVQYLEPSWGYWSVDFATGYYDNPTDYVDESLGEGWKHWFTENKINVIAYCELPKNKFKNPWEGMSQKETIEKFGEGVPNLGNIGK